MTATPTRPPPRPQERPRRRLPARRAAAPPAPRSPRLFPGEANVTVVEAADEDPAALRDGARPHHRPRPGHRRTPRRRTGLGAGPVRQSRLRLRRPGRGPRTGTSAVCNIGSSGAEKQNVAEQTFALMLALAKQLVPAHTALVEADWALPRLQQLPHRAVRQDPRHRRPGPHRPGSRPPRRRVRHEHRLRRAAAGSPPETEARLGGARHVSLDELLRTSDYVTLHAPLTDATRHLLDAERLALLKPTAFVINTARGALIDQDALADALENGRPRRGGHRRLRPRTAHAGPASAQGPERGALPARRRASPARRWSASPWPPSRTSTDFLAGGTPRDVVN